MTRSRRMLDLHQRNENEESTVDTETWQAAWRLVRAQGRMLEEWGEDGDGPFTRTREELWRELHEAGDALRDMLHPRRPLGVAEEPAP